MKRPLSDKRPVGPFVGTDNLTEDPKKFTEFDFDTSGKEVIGVAGTPLPNKDKEELLVIYVLDDFIFQSGKMRDEVDRNINSRDIFENDARVEFLKSGKSASKPFDEQAILVYVPAEDLAVTESQLQRVEDTITRITKFGSVGVKERIYEMEGV